MTITKNSNITINDRSIIKVTGVEGVVNLTENDACVIVCGDKMVIKGKDLKAEKLSVETGELIISGLINSLKFEEKKEKQGLIKRIFK